MSTGDTINLVAKMVSKFLNFQKKKQRLSLMRLHLEAVFGWGPQHQRKRNA